VRFTVDDGDTAPDGIAVWPLYRSIFADRPVFEAWRDDVWERHRRRPGFRLVRAYDGGDAVGFAYGCTGGSGHWWTDNARTVLAPDVAGAWLGGHFEVVTLGVSASARGAGIGRGLLRALTAGLPHDRLLLMTTADDADPARRLYVSDGWRVIGPGIGPATVIMAKRVVAPSDT
jgi:ribosomal protein S18 acetylase RimI-like enzyme